MDKFPGTTQGHAPVLCAEAVAALAPRPGHVLVDATFGGGGYARRLLEAAHCQVIAFDRDPRAVARGHAMAAAEPRLTLVEGAFGDLDRHLDELRLERVDGIVADLGVSSFQLDDPERGFAFGADGPLDMRMAADGPTAADLLASLDEADLARIFRDYGDEPQAGRIARAIVARRRSAPLSRTGELRRLVTGIKARGAAARLHDPSTLVFQGLRIAVNDELGQLQRLLEAAERRLRPGGRLVVVSFHSGEDRIVKQFVDRAGGHVRNPSRHLPPIAPVARRFAWVGRGIVRASAAEIAANPRARSARLRVAERLADEAPASPGEPQPRHVQVGSRRVSSIRPGRWTPLPARARAWRAAA